MVQTPSVPILGGDLLASWGQLPLKLEVSPFMLSILLALVGIFIAIISVVLVYHWRRFPFEQHIFHRAERLYEFGVVLLLTIAVIGIFMS